MEIIDNVTKKVGISKRFFYSIDVQGLFFTQLTLKESFCTPIEWERINFGTPKKRKKLAEMMGITEKELSRLRQDTFASVNANIVKNYSHKNSEVAVDHHGDHRSIGAETYPGVKLDKGEPVSFGF